MPLRGHRLARKGIGMNSINILMNAEALMGFLVLGLSPQGFRRSLLYWCYWTLMTSRAFRYPQGHRHSIVFRYNSIENWYLWNPYRPFGTKPARASAFISMHWLYWTSMPLRALRCPQGHMHSKSLRQYWTLIPAKRRCLAGIVEKLSEHYYLFSFPNQFFIIEIFANV